MPWLVYTSLIDQLAELGVQEIAPFFFGESFIDYRLAESIKYAKNKGINYVFLTTNGSLASIDKVKMCMKNGLNSLKFSLNYADSDQFKEVARVNDKYFSKALTNLRNARHIRDQYNYDCGIYASYILFDGEQGEKMKKLIEEISPYCDEVYELPLYSQAGNIENEGWKFSAGNMGRAGNPVPPIPCFGVGFSSAHVDFKGNLISCCFITGDQFNMGNFTESSFMDVWNNQQYQALRQAHLDNNIQNTPCERCVMWN
jgi:radical SAM protein with 4Fe4S-binding SPASM domain